MRGKLGAVEVRGGELLAAAEAHDALFSFDSRARAAALEIGLPLMPEGEMLFVNLDPRAVLDVDSSLRTTWPVVEPARRRPVADLPRAGPPRALAPTASMLEELVAAHRKRGALIALDDLSGGTESLACLELLKPDFAKIDTKLTAGIQHSAGAPPPRRRARRVRARVRARASSPRASSASSEFEAMRELGVDLGQGFYFGQPTEQADGGRPAPRARAAPQNWSSGRTR